MLRLIVIGLAAGTAVQAWRQFPPDGPLAPDAAMWLFGVGLVLAFLAGWWLSRDRRGATAVASASAEATAAALGNQVHVNVFSRDDHVRGAHPVGLSVPDSPSWRGEAPELSADYVAELLSEGADLSELGLEDSTEEVRG